MIILHDHTQLSRCKSVLFAIISSILVGTSLTFRNALNIPLQPSYYEI